MIKEAKTKKAFTWREYAAVLLTLLLIVVLFVSGIFDKPKIWDTLLWTEMAFEDGLQRNLDKGYGVLNRGPGYTLPEGKYRLKYSIAADGENVIRFTNSNNALIEPKEIRTNPDEYASEIEFEIKDPATNFQIQFDFVSGTSMRVDDLRMYSPVYRDDTITVSLLLVVCCIVFILYCRGYVTRQGIGCMMPVLLALLISCAPAFKENMIFAHDTKFHMARLMSLVEGLEQWQIPVRLGSFTHNGYGAITSVFYPDLLLYPFALLILCGASETYVMNLIYVAVNIVAAFSMYFCAKRLFSNKEKGICATVLYLLSTYRVANLYSRGAMGEMWGMSILPLFVLGVWEVVFGDKERWPLLAVSAALIYLSHMITTLICAVGSVGIGILFFKRIWKERRLAPLMKAMVVALLLGMYTMVPFLTYNLQGIGAQRIQGRCIEHMLSPAQLFLWGEGDLPIDPRDTQLSGQALEIGLPMLIGIFLLLHLVLTAPQKDRNEKQALFFAAVGMISAWMTTRLFPWGHASILTGGLSDYLQFPWRLLLITSIALSLACGYAFMRLAKEKTDLMIYAVLTLSLVMILPTITAETRSYDYLQFGEGSTPRILNREYMIPESSIDLTVDRTVHVNGELRIKDYQKEGSTITMHVDAASDATLSVPMYGYDGYKAAIDGREIAWGLGDNNRLMVTLPAGTSGALKIWFAGRSIWRVADCISLLTAILLTAYIVRRRRSIGEMRPNSQIES